LWENHNQGDSNPPLSISLSTRKVGFGFGFKFSFAINLALGLGFGFGGSSGSDGGGGRFGCLIRGWRGNIAVFVIIVLRGGLRGE